MRFIKLYIVSIVIILFFSGCIATIATVGGAAMTAQEVDEEYDGSYTKYITDKTNSLYKYVKRKIQ